MYLIRKKQPTEEEIEIEMLKKELRMIQEAMDQIYSNLSYVVDPDLIDCYIFELNAKQKKYKFILKQVKDKCASAEI